ncbi:MAG TPA: transglutaminaseTgpA domain-containing protein, partial [Nitrospiraceae bacterium]|nr:transglutaminaseTgpA domain-containing protein [Nitrospiraceae bacterium]
MPFNQAFALSSVTLAATAFSGLVLAQSVPFWLALPTAIILLLSLFHAGGVLFLRRVMAQITDSPTLWNVLLIGAFVILLIDLTVVSRDLLPAGIHFLVVLLGIKLLTLQQRRDYRHLYVISLMAILASAALTTEAWYVPIFMLYLLTAVWTLLLYHLTQETSEIPAAVTPSGMG